MLTAIQETGVPLPAVMVYDREGDPFSITVTNNRTYQLEALKK